MIFSFKENKLRTDLKIIGDVQMFASVGEMTLTIE